MVYAPIYKDTVYTYSGDTLFFRIESPSGNTLLRGEASVRPDGTPAQVYVNRLCEPFLAQEVDPTVTGLTEQAPASMVFHLVEDDETGQTLETYEFLRMYSGDWEGESKVLSDPIRHSVSRNMVMPITVYDHSGSTEDIEIGGCHCEYYLTFDKTSYTIAADVSTSWTLYFNITSTNIPYETFPGARLLGGGPVFTEDYDQGVVARYDDGTGKMRFIYDDTANNGRIYFKFNKNTTGTARTFKAFFYIGPPLCCENNLLCVITINQRAS